MAIWLAPFAFATARMLGGESIAVVAVPHDPGNGVYIQEPGGPFDPQDPSERP